MIDNPESVFSSVRALFWLLYYSTQKRSSNLEYSNILAVSLSLLYYLYLYTISISVHKNFKTVKMCHLMLNIFFPPLLHSAVPTAHPRIVHWHLKPRGIVVGLTFTLGKMSVSWGLRTSEKATLISTVSEFMQRMIHLLKWSLRIELKLLCTSFLHSKSVHKLMCFI